MIDQEIRTLRLAKKNLSDKKFVVIVYRTLPMVMKLNQYIQKKDLELKAPDIVYSNQIDHVLIMTNSSLIYKRAKCDSDDSLVVSNLRIKSKTQRGIDGSQQGAR